MSEQDPGIFKYRDRQLRRLTIKIRLVETGPFPGNLLKVRITDEQYEFAFRLALYFPGEYFFQQTGLSKPENYDKAVFDFIRCLILDGSYREHKVTIRSGEGNLIVVSNLQDNALKTPVHSTYNWIANRFNEIVINHSLLTRLNVEEGKLARRIVLDLLYQNVELSIDAMNATSHFSTEAMRREILGLCASEFVSLNPTSGLRFLTTKGREFFESDPWIGSNNVFIIAACHANKDEDEVAHQAVLSTYKDYFKTPDSTYNPIFQEHEEPEKNIYVDIFNYIDECAFVIADISYDRPNCYVELGYALARGKHVIGYMQKEYFAEKEKAGHGKIPFDLFPIKFFEYSKYDLGKLRESLEERVGVIKRRHGS